MLNKKDKAIGLIREILMIVATVIILIPIYYFVVSAFKLREDIIFYPLKFTPDMFTLENFSEAMRKMKYFKAVKNTGFITVGAVVIMITFGSLTGFVVARVKAARFQLIYRYLIALMVVPFIGCLIPLVVMMNRVGLYNSLWSCLLIQAGWNLPFATFLYTGFMKSLPGDLEEAAMIDGCSLFGTYAKVFLPLLGPVTSTCCIRCGIGVWNEYLVSASFLNSSKTPTLQVSVGKFFGQWANEYGQAFAAVCMCSAPVILLFIFMQKYFIKGMAAGAVTG